MSVLQQQQQQHTSRVSRNKHKSSAAAPHGMSAMTSLPQMYTLASYTPINTKRWS
jgi:hypothetical protein